MDVCCRQHGVSSTAPLRVYVSFQLNKYSDARNEKNKMCVLSSKQLYLSGIKVLVACNCGFTLGCSITIAFQILFLKCH